MDEEHEVSIEQSKSGKESQEVSPEGEHVAPGVTIVRTNTPRLLPFSLISTKTKLPLSPSSSQAKFPGEAPKAPPLPEDDEMMGTIRAENALKRLQVSQTESERDPRALTSEFIWLFEYALDMDPTRLNRPERLGGLAFAYGPATLKGYRLVFEGLDARTGRVLASLDAVQDELETKVWGLLYRVPRRLAKSHENEISLLDKVHNPETFLSVEVKVRESYRQREINCITYIASEAARQQVCQLSPESRVPEPVYLRHLVQIARKQKLPASYVQAIEKLAKPAISAATSLTTALAEQDTEPLPILKAKEEMEKKREMVEETAAVSVTSNENRPGSWNARHLACAGHWLIAFAIYVSLLLVGALLLAIVEGLSMGSVTGKGNLAPPGIPWYVFLYGLAGGCVSCIISLVRPCRVYPPTFVVLIWFVRPFLGGFLGVLAYQLLNSGLFVISTQPVQHLALCSMVGALAGLCEGRIFPKL